MASRIAEDGWPLVVYNRTPHRAQTLKGAGVTVAETPRELAAQSDVIITMLADPGAAADVYEDRSQGLFAGVRRGTVLVDMSTIGPTATRELAAAARRRGCALLDAPVSGSVPAAQQGSLVCFAGGDVEAFVRVRPVLAAVSSRQEHMGASGSGAATKLAVNSVLAVLNQALGEALSLAERSGLDRSKVYDVLAAGAVGAPYLHYKRDAFLGPRTGEVAFTLSGLRKDLELILQAAAEVGAEMPATQAAAGVAELAVAAGRGDADIATVAAWRRGDACSSVQ